MHPETLLPQPILFNAALYAAIALLYTAALFCFDNVLEDGLLLPDSSYKVPFSYLCIGSWPILLFGALILIAVRVGANARRPRRRSRSRSRSRSSSVPSARKKRSGTVSRNDSATSNAVADSPTPRRSSSAPPPSSPGQRPAPPSTAPPPVPGAGVGRGERRGTAIGERGSTGRRRVLTHSQSTGGLHRSTSQQRTVIKSSSYSNTVVVPSKSKWKSQSKSTSTSPIAITPTMSSSSSLNQSQQPSQAHTLTSLDHAQARRHFSDNTQVHSHSSRSRTRARYPNPQHYLGPSSSSPQMLPPTMSTNSLNTSTHTSAAAARGMKTTGSSSKRSITSNAQLVPKGFVSVTRGQKAFAAVGFVWVCAGLLMTTAVAALAFAGRRQQLVARAVKLGKDLDATEWLIPIFTGLVFVPLFAALAFGVGAKAVAAVRPTPQDMAVRTVALDPDDDEGGDTGGGSEELVMGQGMKVRSVSVNVSEGAEGEGDGDGDDMEVCRTRSRHGHVPQGVTMGVAGDSAKDSDAEKRGRHSERRRGASRKQMMDDSGVFTEDEDEDEDEDDSFEEDGDGEGEEEYGHGPHSREYIAHNNQDWRAAARRAAQPDQAVVERMMRQLRDMGFPRARDNLAALQAAGFDLERASDRLAWGGRGGEEEGEEEEGADNNV